MEFPTETNPAQRDEFPLYGRLANTLELLADAPEWEEALKKGGWLAGYSGYFRKFAKELLLDIRQCAAASRNGEVELPAVQQHLWNVYRTCVSRATPPVARDALIANMLTVQRSLTDLRACVDPIPDERDFGVSDVRLAVPEDMPQVFDIGARSFGRPWENTSFTERRRSGNYLLQVAVYGVTYEEVCGRTLGYATYRFHRYIHRKDLQLGELAVLPYARHCGVGTALIKNLLTKLSRRCHRIVAHVPRINSNAQDFFRNCLRPYKGFEETEVSRDDNDKDICRMEYMYDQRETPDISRLTMHQQRKRKKCLPPK